VTISLTKHSLKELRELADDVERELARRGQQRIAEARNQVFAIAKSVGLDVRDLLGKHSKDIGEREKLVSKYRNPQNPRQVWSGRGRHPPWVRAWLADGKSLADLAVEADAR